MAVSAARGHTPSPMGIGLPRGGAVRGSLLLLVAVGGLALAGVGASAPAPTVKTVYDGDTLTLADGRKIRLVQIDTPELGSGECYSRAAHRVLLSLVPVRSQVTLEA